MSKQSANRFGSYLLKAKFLSQARGDAARLLISASDGLLLQREPEGVPAHEAYQAMSLEREGNEGGLCRLRPEDYLAYVERELLIEIEDDVAERRRKLRLFSKRHHPDVVAAGERDVATTLMSLASSIAGRVKREGGLRK